LRGEPFDKPFGQPFGQLRVVSLSNRLRVVSLSNGTEVRGSFVYLVYLVCLVMSKGIGFRVQGRYSFFSFVSLISSLRATNPVFVRGYRWKKHL